MEGSRLILFENGVHIVVLDVTCANKDCRSDCTCDSPDLQSTLRTVPKPETDHDVVGKRTRLFHDLDDLSCCIVSVHVVTSKEYHEGKQKVFNRLRSCLEKVYKDGASESSCTVRESACREGKSDSGNTHQTSDSVCEHGDFQLVWKRGDSDSVCEHGDFQLVLKHGDSDSVFEHSGSGVSWKYVIVVMIVSQNRLGHSVNSTTILLNPRFPVHDKVTRKHEMHDSMRQKVCVERDAGLCLETSLWLLEEKPVLEKKVSKKVVESAHFLPDGCVWVMLCRKPFLQRWADIGLVYFSTSSCKYESCCSREMSERADEVPVTSSGDKTGIPPGKMLCVSFHSGFRINDSHKMVKEEEMDHTHFQDQSLHTVQDEPQVAEQSCQLLNCPETFGPASEKRHDSGESSIPEGIACTSNPTGDLCTSIDYTHMETWNADPLTCPVLEGMPTVPSPDRSPSPQNERGPCLLRTPEEDRTQSCEDALVNSVFPDLLYCHGTDELTCCSKKSMELAAECSSFRVTTKGKCDEHETEKLMEDEEEPREKMRFFIRTEDESTEKMRAFIKTEQEEEGESRLVPWPSPYSKEKKEEKDDKENKDGKKENLDDANYYSWMWQGPNILPRYTEVVVAMLHESLPSRMDLHHSGMENEWNRLKSYNLFTPPGGIFVLRLASSGFFLHTGGEGKAPEQASVKCAFCGVIVAIVEFIMKAVMEVHREWSPSCRFVLGEDVGNVSATQITERSSKEFLHGLDSSFPSFGKSPQASSRNAASMAPGGLQGGKRDLAVDCCPDPTTIVDRAPLDPKGHGLPACGGPVSGNSRTPPPPLANPEQAVRPAVVASSSVTSSSAVAAATAAASSSYAASQRQEPNRPAAPTSFAAQTAGSNTPAPAPPQTATVQQPQALQTGSNATHQPGGNAASSSSSSSSSSPPANRPPAVSVNLPAVSDVGRGSLPAGEGMMDGVSGGTARQEARQEAPAPGNQSGSNVGSGRGDRTGGEDGRPQDRQLVTYDELGIFTQQPKRPDMVVKSVRVNTFERWPHTDSHPADEMAEAGFYYTGHEDLVRCFHCKGGLKTWERSDKPWVEHSRWFPRCPFVRLAKGQKFVDAVQKLNNPQTRPAISEEDVEREICRMEDEERLGLTPSVTLLSAIPPPSPDSDPTWGPLARAALRIDADITEASLSDMAEHLEDENEEMRDSIRCKMCQMNNVNVLFLPCGHLVACTQCAPALRRCAMCRAAVKGSVHVYMDDSHGNRDSNSGTGSQGTTTL